MIKEATDTKKTKAEREYVIQKVQPALLGLMDGSVSTLAPIFATAGLTGRPIDAFYVGLAASLGAGITLPAAEHPLHAVPLQLFPLLSAGCCIRFRF